MKKIDLGQTITILANVGVIAGIIFLGYEIRQNTVALRSTTGQNINSQIAAIYETIMRPEYAGLLNRGDENPADLTPAERRQYGAYNSMILQAWQNMYFQVRDGAYRADLAEGWWQALRDSFEDPGFRQSWHEDVTLSQEFRDFVETELLAGAATPAEGP